ncbi:tyrosine-type recombinase/integrase [Paenibacillus doosanensis]|uniref:tyrosine-type recombinase/integrase n=1 Tax=Paenibacillus doosanensis TaxID=1229154 RepID=UPI00217FED26|nr:tyrosine-type recombinase/integrase [Paenibacillus doosanensis]MCS7460360.1 tyrosine-type recombinase/integrase [Paenibacillus doosanensis]
MNIDEIKKLQRALSDKPRYKSKHFSGEKKRGKQAGKTKITDKQRRIDHLSSRQRHELIRLHADLDRVMIANSKISRTTANKPTKRDARKGNNGNLGVEGIWSSVTFERYKKSCRTFLKFCYENFDSIRSLRDIKPRMIGKYIEDLKNRGCSAKTISAYVSAIEKMAESSVKAGIKSHAGLVNSKHREMVPTARKAERRRGREGGTGYTLREAQVIIKQARKHYSIYEQVLLELLTYGGSPRISELLRISFDQIDFEKRCIYLNKKNQNKNNRPRMLKLPDIVLEKLKQLEPYFPNKETTIWGHRMSVKQVRGLIKSCAAYGKVKCCAAHDFRKAGLEYQMRRLQKYSKQQLIDSIMEFVSISPQLNPIVNRGGVKTPKYTPEFLASKQIRWLQNQYLTQMLGHSRNDKVCPYKRG